MTSIVTIQSIDENLIKVDADGRGQKTFTVTNISGGSLRLGLQCQFDNAEQKDWARPRGDIERELGDQGSDQIIVDITAPSDAAPGTYEFQLLAYSMINPNLDFTVSDSITIEVPEPEPTPEPKPFPWWIPVTAVVVLLLIGGGVTTWLLWPKALTVPEIIIGETKVNATKMIEDLGLVVKSETANETEDFPAGTVMQTDPLPGEEVEKGGTVLLTVAKKVSIPTTPGPHIIVGPQLIVRRISCPDAVQGKIAWDYKGSKRWAQANINRLCKGATNTSQPAVCFKKVMHGGLNYGGGTRWQWKNAIDLCEGTQHANRTIQCFKNSIARGKPWKTAIASCNP
ncbi:MAG: PASTA domain-containing protein [Gammaproteobacteria bacterium]|nr:MAG: PASTA domain-containing protein [Gammaproteobacteria bacterium]